LSFPLINNRITPKTLSAKNKANDYVDLIKMFELYSKELLHQCQNIPLTYSKGNYSETRTIIQDEILTWNYYLAKANNKEKSDLKESFT
jgi:hypothetical protein